MSKCLIAAASPHKKFNKAANTSPASPKKRPAPLSVRLSETELATLKHQAGDVPLSTYVKSKVFDGAGRSFKRTAVQDYEMLARILSALGQSELFRNLDTVAKAIERGDLSLSPEEEEGIALACLLVLDIREDLIAALGLKPR